ncbi:response regulator transcription factor [Paenibacillus hamazuiensis]|uniref:response regulator transcription factor n=1 Tax=Paenibacillus hamazuiensis TaxID=2936508 RepID=UPI00200C417C|nr:response regulator [Paenibacillus hamazuiensis]
MNILVAEDELIALEEIEYMLQTYTDRHSVYTAQNAFKILELCREVRPDVLITDIRMPQMDGLELIGALKRHFPDMAAIITSGYDDFSYARKGMQLGVKEYLLKPLKESALHQAVDKAIRELQEEMAKNRKLSDWTLIRELLGQASDASENLAGEPCGIVMSFLGNETSSEVWDPNLQIQAGDIEGLPPETRIVYPDSKKQCVIVTCRSKEAIVHQLGGWARKIHEAALRRAGTCVHTTFFIKESGDTLHSAYASGVQRIEQQMRLDSSTITDGYSRHAHPDLTRTWEKVRMLEIYLSKRELQKVRPEIDKMINELKIRQLTVKELVIFMTDMLTALQYNLTQSLSKKIAEVDDIASSIKKMTSYAELGDWLQQQLLEYLNKLGTNNLDARELVQMLMHQVKHSFEAPDSLQQFAKEHHVSAGYLSRMFKTELGIHFSDYLLEIRMERARSLLDIGTLSLAEVSRRVGYDDPKYFSQLFKKTYGITPSEYGKQKKNSPRIGK